MKIVAVGLGLIGGSLGRAIKQKTEHVVYAFDKDADALKKCKILSF